MKHYLQDITDDLDEVRIGLLEHLCDFYKMLPEKQRHEMLTDLNVFMRPSESRDYRFRLTLLE